MIRIMLLLPSTTLSDRHSSEGTSAKGPKGADCYPATGVQTDTLADLIALGAELSVEHQFMCPYCGEEISMILDFSVPSQVYVEDCEVCCNPIEISYEVEGDMLASFNAKRLQ
jgi:hypothetical protein